MSKTQYGTTWWGKQWLAALSDIDYDNRIPRGKTYANTGRVLSFSINESKNLIKARVEGNFEPYYRVRITLPSITPEQHKRLIREIARSPLIVAKLSARKLDPEVLTICRRLEIKLFPQRWSDLEMSCSCPDFAVPCKHIAAVIYKISQEIDANPFILFTLRGIDLIGDLKKEGVLIERAVKAELPSWREILNSSGLSFEGTDFESFDVTTPEGRKDWLSRLSQLTFSQIHFDAESLTKILSPTPAGYVHGALRDLTGKVLTQAAKLARTQIQNISERTPPVNTGAHAFLYVNTWGQARVNADVEWQEYDAGERRLVTRRVGQKRDDFSIVRLHEMFSGYLNAKRLSSFPEDLEALFDAWLFASKLTAAGAVIPKIYEPSPGCFAVRWIPAVTNLDVGRMTAEVGHLLKGLNPQFVEIFERPESLNPQIMGEVILGIFIQSYVIAAYEKLQGINPAVHEQGALFGGQFVDCEDDHIADAARLRLTDWLSPFTIARSRLLPVLTVRDLYSEKKAETRREAFDRAVSIELGFDIEFPGAASSMYFSFEDIMKEESLEKYKFDAMKISASLSDYCPELAALLRSVERTADLTMNELTPLMFESLPALNSLGVRVVLPRTLKHLLVPEANVELDLDAEWEEGSGFMGLASLLTFDWRIAVGDRVLSKNEFALLAKDAGNIVRFHNTFMFVDPKQISQIQKKLYEKDLNHGKIGLLHAALSGKYKQSNVRISEKLKRYLEKLFREGDETLPRSVKADLRPYQQTGFRWMLRNLRIGVGSILADDMGLGKTLQVLSVLDYLRVQKELDEKPALIVVPTTLLTNWLREAEKFTPKLNMALYYGANRKTNEAAHVFLTTYGTLTRSAELKKKPFKLLILDEAQAVKNHKTAASRSVRSVKSDLCIAMSGTPVENRLLEYWSIMEAVNPGFLGSERQFKKEYALPIEAEHDIVVADRFKQLTAPFILRRLKSDKTIIKDLPEKISVDEYCVLTPEQAALYEKTVERGLAKVNAGMDRAERSALVLQLIIQLKQICNAPLQYEKGSPYKTAAYSGKMQRLFGILDDLLEADRKVLVFTQFREMGKLLQKWIGEYTGKTPLFIHGGLSVKDRQSIVDRFQNDRSEKILVLSLKAAGTGLNLTAASAVVHYDLWWNPAVESQATDRAYRIGQKKNVSVYRLISANTFEERINAMIESKKALAEMTVATGEHWLTDLSDEQLTEIFTLSDAVAGSA